MVVEINHILLLQGVLQDRSEIAVKQLLTNSQQGIEEFLNEVVLITNVRHKNLVKLKGCCLMGGACKRLLVYEFVDNNNLAETLFGKCFFPIIKSNFFIKNHGTFEYVYNLQNCIWILRNSHNNTYFKNQR
jgi:serine/threonine protein kinase